MTQSTTCMAGWGRVEITPQESVPMAGYGNTSARMSQNVLDPLYATCIAFSDTQGKTALLFTVDLIDAGLTCTTHIRPAISAATGVPMELIQCCATHTHAAPDTRNTQLDCAERYRQFQQERMIQAALQALSDRKPARLSLARADTENLNFVRRYQIADGSWYAPNSPRPTQPFVAHECPADSVIQLAKLTREGGADIVLCNYGVHQTHTGGMTKFGISADIAGVMRSRYEQETGAHFAYFTGACGDVVPSSEIAEENIIEKFDHIGHGNALAECALAATDFTPANLGPIQSRHTVQEHALNHATDHLADKGREAMEYFAATNDRAAANQIARSYGFSSVYHAGAVWRRKSRPAAEPIPLDALSVGDLAFTLAPCEMFCENGRQIKAESPFPMTMVLTLANRNTIGYMPTRRAFEHGGYEPDTCAFAPGIGEGLAQRLITMCTEMYSNNRKEDQI